MTNVFRALLLLALLALGGEALAQPCHEGKPVNAPMSDAGHTVPAADNLSQKSSHCSKRECTESSATGAAHDCDNACSCCPGHCANALPATLANTEFPVSNQSSTAYRPLDSSPAPESHIRPPIPA